MNIKGKIVTLRAMTHADMQMICDMFNDPELEDVVVGWAFPLSYEQQEAWFEKHLGDSNNFRFIIHTSEDGAVGIATLTDIDWKNRRATHGIKLANKKNRTKGVGTDSVMAIMRYAFDELGLHRLDGSWFETNVASKGLYTKCGWKAEGIRRDYIYKRGQWRDLTVVGITENDYRELIKRNNYWGGVNYYKSINLSYYKTNNSSIYNNKTLSKFDFELTFNYYKNYSNIESRDGSLYFRSAINIITMHQMCNGPVFKPFKKEILDEVFSKSKNLRKRL